MRLPDIEMRCRMMHAIAGLVKTPLFKSMAQISLTRHKNAKSIYKATATACVIQAKQTGLCMCATANLAISCHGLLS